MPYYRVYFIVGSWTDIKEDRDQTYLSSYVVTRKAKKITLDMINLNETTKTKKKEQ